MQPARSTILVLTLVGVLTALQALLGNIVAEQLKGWLGPWADYVLPTFLIITGILIGFAVREQLGSSRDATQFQAARNRRVMLEQVWRTWIDGVLKPSLYQETPVPLGMQARPDAVRPPRTAVIKRLQQADHLLPSDTSILQVFNDVGGALLILGAPGAGKTTLLLELTRDLIERAGKETSYPIPVIFPLTTWAERRLPLADWLVSELVDRYQVQRKLAQLWIADNGILPLLDGLDEVVPDARAACVDAINIFRATRGHLPIAVCSRSVDYEELTVKLRLHAAIMVQPLSREEVRAYARTIGLTFTPSRTSPLWDLLTTPLMLNIATVAYAGRPVEVLQTSGSWAERQEQLMSAYVERRLSHAVPDPRYSADQTMRYLNWLARQMQRHNQTVFYIERIQLDWLPHHHQLRLLTLLVFELIFGLVSLLAGAVVGVMVGPMAGVVVGAAVFWQFFWLGGGLVSNKEVKLTHTVRWSWREMRRGLSNGLIVGLLLGLGCGLSSGLLFGLGSALVTGLIGGLGTGLIVGLSRVQLEHWTQPNQGIHRSGQSALLLGLLFGLGGGLSGALIFGMVAWMAEGVSEGLNAGLIGGVSIGLLLGMGGGLYYGGDAWLRHYLLRLLLIRNGSIPWHYIQFLDFAAQHNILRKVGGGYIFIHRLLLDYFAKQYKGPETTDVSTVRSVRGRKEQ